MTRANRERARVKVRSLMIATLDSAIDAVKEAQRERCAFLRTTSSSVPPPTEPPFHYYCEGYYERGLRCPDCPEDDGADAIGAIERLRDGIRDA